MNYMKILFKAFKDKSQFALHRYDIIQAWQYTHEQCVKK